MVNFVGEKYVVSGNCPQVLNFNHATGNIHKERIYISRESTEFSIKQFIQ